VERRLNEGWMALPKVVVHIIVSNFAWEEPTTSATIEIAAEESPNETPAANVVQPNAAVITVVPPIDPDAPVIAPAVSAPTLVAGTDSHDEATDWNVFD